MAWLEFTIETTPQSIDSAVTALSARGFSDLVIEDQSEFETFLEENRAYWDYIDEGLQKKLEGLSRIKLYLEDTDGGGRKRLDAAEKAQKRFDERTMTFHGQFLQYIQYRHRTMT
jgi:ribosomal protein L11 methyltransferase